MEIKGFIKTILDPVSGSSARGEWSRQDVVIEYQDGNYTKTLAVTFFNKLDQLAGLGVGQEVTVSFSVSSREYNGRWFTQADGWKIEPIAAAKVSQTSAPAPEPVEWGKPQADDLPF